MAAPALQCKLLFFDALSANPDGVQLMRQRCRELFTHLSLVDFYFDDPDLAPLLILLLVAATAPLCFLYAASTARHVLAVEMKRLAELFRMSQSLAAVTLLALASSAPDIVAALSHNRHAESTAIMASMGMGVYFFGLTAITGLVCVVAPRPVRLPRAPLVKELLFSLAAVASVAGAGVVGQVGYLFVAWLGLLLAAYLFASLYIESLTKAREFERSLNSASPSRAQLKRDVPADTSQELPVLRGPQDSEESSPQKPPASLESRTDGGSQRSAQVSEEEYVVEISKTLRAAGSRRGLRKVSCSKALMLPLLCVQTLTVPHQENPLCDSWLEPLPVFLGSLFTLEIFRTAPWPLWVEAVAAAAVTGAFVLLGRWARPSKSFQVFRAAVVVAAALAWVQFLMSLVIDYLAFLSFFYSANDVILRSFLLASGTSVGELVGSHALASVGAEIMAVLSVYSGAFINLVVVVAVNALYHIEGGAKRFDIFGLRHRAAGEPLHLESLYVLGFTGLTALVLLAHLAFFAANGFRTSARFGGLLLGGYFLAFLVTVALGVN